MSLQTYLRENGLTYDAFAEKLGITSTSVYRYARGIRFPKRDIMVQIEHITNGAVTYSDHVIAEEERITREKHNKAAKPKVKTKPNK